MGTVPRSARKRDLYRLAVARSDLAAAGDALDLILNGKLNLGSPAYMPLLNVAVVSYARPFTQNKPHGPLPKKWGTFEDKNRQSMHDDMLEMRHQYIAHSDQAARTVMVAPAGYVIPGTGAPLVKPGISVRSIAYDREFILAFKAHIHELGSRVNTEVEQLLDELYEGKELPKEPFELVVDEGL